MALTFADYKSLVKHGIGGGEPNAVYTSADATKGQIVNEAGRHMTNGFPWSWRTRPSRTLTLAASQTSVPLPEDTGEILLVTRGVDNWDARATSMLGIQMMRQSSTETAGSYWYALVYQPQADRLSHALPALEIFPGGTEGDTIQLAYRATWVELTLDVQVPNIPLAFESLLAKYVVAFARGQQDDVFEAVDQVDNSIFRKMLVEQDARGQWDFGFPSGGHLEGMGFGSSFILSSDPLEIT